MIESPFKVGDEVSCRRERGEPIVGVVRRITTFDTREAFHIVVASHAGGEWGFGTSNVTLVRPTDSGSAGDP